MIDVHNLVITNVSTSNGTNDYFKFDPDSDESELKNPSVSFSIQDRGDVHRYSWYLWTKPTRNEPNSVMFSGIVDMGQSTSKKVTITINDKAKIGNEIIAPLNSYQQRHLLSEWGTYGFDLRVQELGGLSDSDVWLNSQKLSVENHDLQIEFAEDGSAEAEHDMGTAFFDYKLEDEREQNPSQGQIRFLSSNFDLLSSKNLNLQIGVQNTHVKLYSFTGDEQSNDTQQDQVFRAIISASDSHKTTYRDHKNKPIQAVNKRVPKKSFHIEHDWMERPYSTNLPDINYNPARFIKDKKMIRAFNRGGWIYDTAGTNPKRVRAVDCQPVNVPNAIQCKPGHDHTHYVDFSQVTSVTGGEPEIGVGEQAISALSDANFQNKNRRNAPRAGSKLGRYVHLIGASRHIPTSGPFAGQFLMGLADTNRRWSCIFFDRIEDGLKNQVSGSQLTLQIDRVSLRVAIHEVGHHFLGGHFNGDPEENVDHTTPKELEYWGDAFRSDIPKTDREDAQKKLGELRVLIPGQSPSLPGSYEHCVFHPSGAAPMSYNFCKKHNDKMRSYKWEN